jgi:glycine betaine/proline transport system permease protein
MATLGSALMATVLVMLLGVTLGVWIGRSRLGDRPVRPALDAAQVMPPFVYVVPFIAIFGATRFTPSSRPSSTPRPSPMKIIADGIRSVPETTVEAATAIGCNTWQAITLDVVAGFSQGELYGKGLAAGLAIALLGVMFDRITHAAARRAGV